MEAVRRHMPICCKSPNHIDASSTFHSISGIGTGGEPGGSLIPVYCGEIACCTRCWAPGLLFHRRYDPQFISRLRNERSPTPLRTPAGWQGVGYNLLDLDSTVHRTSQGTGQQGFSMPSSNPLASHVCWRVQRHFSNRRVRTRMHGGVAGVCDHPCDKPFARTYLSHRFNKYTNV